MYVTQDKKKPWGKNFAHESDESMGQRRHKFSPSENFQLYGTLIVYRRLWLLSACAYKRNW